MLPLAILCALISTLPFPCTSESSPVQIDPAAEYTRRVDLVRDTPGFIALWDFVLRDSAPGGSSRFSAHQPEGSKHDFRLDAVNYVRNYWNAGRSATYDDFPLLGRGPFGQAVRFRPETDPDFRPCLLVPRMRLHNTPLDRKGPGASVSMVVWLIRESGNHALAGIWHEGTDLDRASQGPAALVEKGRRQYALFAGLAANSGAVAAHVSENGAASFSDRYARNLAVSPENIPAVPADSAPELLDQSWAVAAFSFDNARDTVTTYYNGQATEYWLDNPAQHPFYQWAAKAYQQANLHNTPGIQPGEDPLFPPDQFYLPPEEKPLKVDVQESLPGTRVELRHFPFTRVRVTLRLDPRGGPPQILSQDLVALKVNPFYFPHDLYAPTAPENGGPFTIGRVIHSSRSVGITGYIGGVAVFDTPLSAEQMKNLATFGQVDNPPPLLHHQDVAPIANRSP